MLIFLCSLTFADPQDIPDETDSTEESERTEEPQNSTQDSPKDNTEETDSNQQKSNVLLQESMLGIPVQEEITEELVSGALQYDGTVSEEEENWDFSWYRGFVDYAFDIRLWESEGSNTMIYTGSFSGDPQYLWERKEDFGPTLGLKFRFMGTSTLNSLAEEILLGGTTGIQLGKGFRVNTSAGYLYNRFFYQEEISKDTSNKEISYRYQELLPFHGILWENSFTINIRKRSLQASYGIPFQLGGDRNIGAVFVDSYRATAKINFNTLLIGYEYNQYPSNTEHVISIGSSLGR